jgi:hypothetical protein
VLDLQSIFDRMYDGGPFARTVDYTRPPPIPLEPEDAAWAEEWLRGKGLGASRPG